MSPRTLLPLVTLASIPLSAMAEVPDVVTDIAPIHGLVSRVMAGIGEPHLLVPPGASPHGYSLRPSDARALSAADAVFWIGEALEPWLESSIAQLAGGAQVGELLAAPGTLQLQFRSEALFAAAPQPEGDDHGDHEDHGHDEHGHDNHDEHDHAEHAHEEHEDHQEHGHDDHGDHDAHDHDAQDHDAHAGAMHEGGAHHDHDHHGVDPHAWLSPANGTLWLSAIAETLAGLDPEHAEAYRANAAQGQAEIETVTAEISANLAATTGQFVVFHDAYQYFEQSFGLSSLGAISLSDASDPSVARIAEIRDAITASQVSCVFSEPQFNPGLVASVTSDAGVKSLVVDPLGTDLAPGAGFYVALLQEMGQSFATCLGE